MKKLIIVLSVLIFVTIGCESSNLNDSVNEVQDVNSSNSKVSSSSSTNTTPYDISEESYSMSEEEYDEFIKDMTEYLNQVALQIIDVYANDDIQLTLDNYISNSDNDIIYLYFGDIDGNLYISPEVQMPTGYDCRERPYYTKAVEEGTSIFPPYVDGNNNRIHQSLSKAVYIDEKLIGVIAIDVLLETIE